MRKMVLGLILLYVAAFNTGCVAIFAAGAITGAGQYIKYSMDSKADRTFMGDIDYVTDASLRVLKEMKITIKGVDKHDAGARIFASSQKLMIRVSLDPISANTTKVSIDVSKYTVLKDRATAKAIISQINIYLSRAGRRLARSVAP